MAMTVRQWVNLKGGTESVAEEYGVGATAVGNWQSWNKLPRKLHYQVYKDCIAQSIDFDPEHPAPTTEEGEAA